MAQQEILAILTGNRGKKYYACELSKILDAGIGSVTKSITVLIRWSFISHDYKKQVFGVSKRRCWVGKHG